jgi:hypothetical protein
MAIDEGDLDRCPAQATDGLQPRKATADHQHAVRFSGGPGHGCSEIRRGCRNSSGLRTIYPAWSDPAAKSIARASLTLADELSISAPGRPLTLARFGRNPR